MGFSHSRPEMRERTNDQKLRGKKRVNKILNKGLTAFLSQSGLIFGLVPDF